MDRPDYFRQFDGMCWPASSQDMADLGWSLRYNEPSALSRDRLMVAASIVTAYAELIRLPEKQRNRVIRELRKSLAATPSTGEPTA